MLNNLIFGILCTTTSNFDITCTEEGNSVYLLMLADESAEEESILQSLLRTFADLSEEHVCELAFPFAMDSFSLSCSNDDIRK